MNVSPRFRNLFASATIAVIVVLLAAAVVVSASGETKLKLAATVAGGVFCVGGAFLSGNPRLFCLWCLGFSIPFLFARTFGTVINKGGGEVAINLDVTDIFLLVFCAFLARDIFMGHRPGIRIPKAIWFWLAILGMGVYSAIAGPYRTTAVHEIFRMVKILVFFLVLCQELDTPRRILHWCGALMLGLITNAIVGLAEYYYHTTFGLSDLGEVSEDVIETLAETSLYGAKAWRVGAFMLHPNIFAAFLATLLPLAIVCFLIERGTIRKAYYLSALVLGSGALVATGSRSGWISFLAAFATLMVILISHLRFRRSATAAAIASGILFIGISIIAREQILQRIFQSKAEALSFRGVFNNDAKAMIAEYPLWGIGLNSYVLNLPDFEEIDYGRYGSWPPPVHNIYYLWWAETGLIGLCLHLAMWGAFAWTAIRNLRVKDERMFAVNVACLVGFLALALDGFVSFSLRVTPTLKTFWMLAAVVMAIRYWRLQNEVSPAPVPQTARIYRQPIFLAPQGPPLEAPPS